MTPLKEQIIKEFEDKYGYEEIYICADCGHSKESHYWNGGGISKNAGYDRCKIDGCECSSENWIKEKIKIDVSCYTNFISQALDRQLEEIRKDNEIIPKFK